MALKDAPAGSRLVLVADPALLAERAAALGVDWDLPAYPSPAPMSVLPVELAAPVVPGEVNPANATYVLDCLRRAATGCLRGEFAAMVTGPVHKAAINAAGIPFSGHTEFLAELTAAPRPVMLLAADELRVALATTHLPLRDVADRITTELLDDVIRILHHDLVRRFRIPRPRIVVLGLNPHAGESGHLGREEIEIIGPALEAARGRGLDLVGPLPADTAFTPRVRSGADAVLAMYHDQGLPVLKALGFGRAVNITLGLPIIRTSVDHGTALHLAGRGQAEDGSFGEALRLAALMARTADDVATGATA